MLVGTVEALDRLALGAKVLVSGDEWERVAEGLRRNKETLPLVVFKRFAEDRLIRTPQDLGITFPAWRSDGSYTYLLLSEDPVTGGYLMMRYHRQAHNTIVHLTEAQVRGMSTITRIDTISEQAERGMVQLAGYLAPERGMATMGSPNDLVADLHTLAASTPITGDGLDEVLLRHGIGRMRSGEVTVSAKGTARMSPDALGVGVEVDRDHVIGWRFVYMFAAMCPVAVECLCGEFVEDLYRARLPQDTITEQHTVVCTEADCVNRKQKRVRS